MIKRLLRKLPAVHDNDVDVNDKEEKDKKDIDGGILNQFSLQFVNLQLSNVMKAYFCIHQGVVLGLR